jgi:glycosyltransferase involved in cell wall biosynthesis
MCIFHKIDVLLSLGYSQPIFLRCKSIVTIHDLNWYYHPEDFGAINLRVWEVLTRLSAHFATHIITDSQASRKSIIKVLGVREKKVTSILHGTPAKIDITPRESVKVLKTMGINGSYLFTVLSSAPHKNLTTLLKAFSSLRARYPDLRLVVAGLGNHPSCTDGSIIYAGYVTRKELAALYSGATVFVFPSAYEGFGYPVLEAMQYGAPVVSSDAYSLPEVVGKAGLLNSAYDQNGYRLNIEKILGHSTNRNMLVTKGVARSKELSWKSTSLETFQIITATWGTD